MKQKIFVLILMLISSVMVFAETFDELKLKADNTFYSGKYGEARNLYTILWGDYADDYAKQQISICDKCKKYLEEGVDAEREGNYSIAISKYQDLLALNPQDKAVQCYISQCKTKLYTPYLSEAKRLYREGRYEDAKSKLKEYSSVSGETDIELLSDITNCLVWQSEAKNAYSRKDFESAKRYYERILATNPTDASSAMGLADVNKSLTPAPRTIYIEKEPAPKPQKVRKEPKERKPFPLRPRKKRFNWYVMSGFSNRLGLGGGLGGNISYFNITFDGGGTIDVEGIDTDYGSLNIKNLKNVCEVAEGEFEQANMQFTLTPGVNLKYFIIGCGFGLMINKKLDTTERKPYYGDYIHGEVSKTSRLMYRPTLTGYIPVGDDEDSFYGFSVSVGYSIVSGLSKMNHLMVALGFFF